MYSKRCPTCGETKAVTDFHRYKSGKRTGQPIAYCIPCANTKSRVYGHGHYIPNREVHEAYLQRMVYPRYREALELREGKGLTMGAVGIRLGGLSRQRAEQLIKAAKVAQAQGKL